MTKRMFLLFFLAKTARLLGFLAQKWILLLIAAFFISPIGPHLRTEYEYYLVGNHKVFTRCTYLGSRGFITPSFNGYCPLVTILDRRQS